MRTLTSSPGTNRLVVLASAASGALGVLGWNRRVEGSAAAGDAEERDDGTVEADEVGVVEHPDPSAELRTVHGGDLVDHDAARFAHTGGLGRLDGEPEQRVSVGSVVQGQTVTESVPNRSSCTMTAGRGLPAYPAPPATVQISPRFTRRASPPPNPRTPGRHRRGCWWTRHVTGGGPPPRSPAHRRRAPRSARDGAPGRAGGPGAHLPAASIQCWSPITSALHVTILDRGFAVKSGQPTPPHAAGDGAAGASTLALAGGRALHTVTAGPPTSTTRFVCCPSRPTRSTRTNRPGGPGWVQGASGGRASASAACRTARRGSTARSRDTRSRTSQLTSWPLTARAAAT